jgi:FdhE protein
MWLCEDTKKEMYMTSQLQLRRSRTQRKIAALSRADHIPAVLRDLIAETALLQEASLEKARPRTPEENEIAEPERHGLGAPLVDREALGFDPEAADRLFHDILQAATGAGGDLGRDAGLLADLVADRETTPAEIFAAYVGQDEEFFAAWEARFPDTPRLVRFLAASSLAPGLEATAVALAAKHHDLDSPWPHGNCPVCGGLPLVGRLAGKEGALHLTCSYCRLEYRAKRLQCPFCLEDDHTRLGYFTAREETGYQVHFCRSCDLYIKITDFRDLDRDSVQPLDDLESMALDFAAGEQGFSRPTLSAWGF